ncbi:hypothetical protein PybrP1_004778, partial [[Pythium] brassicae (nom. inval.)]
MYQLGYSVSSTLAASGTDTITTNSTMKFANIQTISDTFAWLTDTFVPSVFVTEDYNGKALEKDKWGRVAMFNKFLLDLYPNCYDPYRTTIGSVVITFDTNATAATAIINELKDRGDWLSFATQKLQITVVTYNGEVEAYTVTDLTVTFHQGGLVEPSSLTTPALSDPYKGTLMVVLDVLVGLLWLGRFSWIMHKRRERGQRIDFDEQSRVSKADFDLDLVVITPVAVFYGVLLRIVKKMKAENFRDNLAHLVVSGKTFVANSEERKGLLAVTDSLKEIATLTVTLRVVAIFAVLLMGGMVLISFHAHPTLSVLTRTIACALRKFGSVFVVFVVVFVTFSASGTVLFGDRAESFSSFGKSLETCINMLFGSFDYSAIQDMYIPAPMLFYWAFMIIVSLVLLNMMLAIVLDAEMVSTTWLHHRIWCGRLPLFCLLADNEQRLELRISAFYFGSDEFAHLRTQTAMRLQIRLKLKELPPIHQTRRSTSTYSDALELLSEYLPYLLALKQFQHLESQRQHARGEATMAFPPLFCGFDSTDLSSGRPVGREQRAELTVVVDIVLTLFAMAQMNALYAEAQHTKNMFVSYEAQLGSALSFFSFMAISARVLAHSCAIHSIASRVCLLIMLDETTERLGRAVSAVVLMKRIFDLRRKWGMVIQDSKKFSAASSLYAKAQQPHEDDSHLLEDIALNKRARQSSTVLDMDARNAVQADTIRCAHTKEELQPWWEVDLANYYVVHSVKIWLRDEVSHLYNGNAVRGGGVGAHTYHSGSHSDPYMNVGQQQQRKTMLRPLLQPRLRHLSAFPLYISVSMKTGVGRDLDDILTSCVSSHCVGEKVLAPIVWHAPPNSRGRFVRIQAEGQAILHIEKVHVYIASVSQRQQRLRESKMHKEALRHQLKRAAFRASIVANPSM